MKMGRGRTREREEVERSIVFTENRRNKQKEEGREGFSR